MVPAAGNQGNVGRKAGETVPEGKPVLQITDWPIGYSGDSPFEKSVFSKIFLPDQTDVQMEYCNAEQLSCDRQPGSSFAKEQQSGDRPTMLHQEAFARGLDLF